MKIYDLLTIDHKKDTFRGFATASLKSFSSTVLIAGECPVNRSTVAGITQWIIYFILKYEIEFFLDILHKVDLFYLMILIFLV